MRRSSHRPLSARVLVALLAALVAAAVVCAPASARPAADLPSSEVAAAAFTPGDLVVYRVGDAADALTNASGTAQGAPVYLDEYTPSGTLVESVPLPTSESTSSDGTEYPLVASGTATSEGELTLSGNGECLLATGYDAAPGTTGLTSSAAATVHRTVAVVDAAASVDTSTALSDFATGNNPRSATSDNCTNLWVGGAAGGVEYTTVGSSTGTTLTSSTDKNVREVQVVDGQLYTSADPTKAGLSIATVGVGLPMTSGQTLTNLNYATAPQEPYGYALLTTDADTTSGGPDTLYVADDAADAILKYNLVGGNWTPEGSADLPTDANGDAVFGLTADDVDGTVEIFATATDASGTDGAIYSVTDASGYAGQLSGTATQVASAASGQAFRGIAFAPGTIIGAGGTPPPSETPVITPAQNALPAAQDATDNPSLAVTLSDSDTSVAPSDLTLTASSSDTAVAPNTGITLTQDPGTGDWELSVTPGSTPGEATITLTAQAPDGTMSTQDITYGLSAPEGGLTGETGAPIYYDGAANASTEVGVGDGYFIAGDDLTNVLHLYDSAHSGQPVASYDFTGTDLPDGTSSIDIEAAASTEVDGAEVIYWFGSQSDSSSGNTRPAADTVFATEVMGEGATTQLQYLGSYTGLRGDLINWDEANGNPLGLSAASTAAAKSTAGFNIEGAEFAPGSGSTVYLAFRGPLEPYADDSATQDVGSASQDALLIPLTNLPDLIQSSLTAEQDDSGLSTFGPAIQPDLGGLGIREIRENADGQYLIVAGTSGSSNSAAALYAWDGEPADPPVLTRTALPVGTPDPNQDDEADWAWEGIAQLPTPLADGGSVELVQDDGGNPWYGNGETSKTKPALDDALNKDLGAHFTLELARQSVAVQSTAPSSAPIDTTYAVAATASSGLPVSFSVDAVSTSGACTISGATVSFTGAGMCVIDADQAGDYGYDPAPPVQQTVTVVAAGPPAPTSPPTTTTTASPPTTTTTASPPATTTTASPPATTTTASSATTTTAASPPTPAPPATGPLSTTRSADAGNDRITVTIPRIATCLAPTMKLAVSYRDAVVAGSRRTRVTFVHATLTFDGKLRATAKRRTESFALSLAGLKRATYTLKIVTTYHYQVGRKLRTLAKTQNIDIKVC
jgi:hypothetical protein